MTEFEINLNYRQALKQAGDLEFYATQVDDISSKKMPDMLGKLRTAWESDNSYKYFQKAEQVRLDIEDTAADIRAIAEAIRETAEAVRAAELKALEIARSRTYR